MVMPVSPINYSHLPALQVFQLVPGARFLLGSVSFHAKTMLFKVTSYTLFCSQSRDNSSLGGFSISKLLLYRVPANGTGWRKGLLSTLPRFGNDETHVCEINRRSHRKIHQYIILSMFVRRKCGDFSHPHVAVFCLAAKANGEGFRCDVIA